jgi:ATP-dependent DNA helicase RecQ
MPPTVAPTVADAFQVLQETFGFPAFKEGQEPAIGRLLEGKSVLAIFPTGAGKSLCYQLPALLFEGVTLVVSPLIALMKDQIDYLKSKGIAAARLDSSLSLEEGREVFAQLRAGTLKMLFIAPERLANERFLATLKKMNISMLAVDEAHCISEWGHNFRPDYLKLAVLSRELKVGRVLALTATATPVVAKQIAAAFHIEPADVVQTGFYRSNLNMHVIPCEAGKRQIILQNRLASRLRGPTIVYVTLQRTAEEVAKYLTDNGFPAEAYHAGLEGEVRHAIQDRFMASADAIVVATIAFGMGIDKRDIRYVFHYNLSKSLENYAQEIGRAGRDGKLSYCEMLAAQDDIVVLENFTFGDTPTEQAVASLVKDVFSRGPVFDIAPYDLSNQHDIRPIVIETTLTYLELMGYVESTGPFYTEYKFIPLTPGSEMLKQFDPARAEFLKRVFQCAEQLHKWWKLDLDFVTRTTGEPRQRIVTALNFLEDLGHLKLTVGGVRQGYRLKNGIPDLPPIIEKINARFIERENRDVERLQEILKYSLCEGCRVKHLLSYFGEVKEDNCGHCDRCEGQPPGRLPITHRHALGDRELATLKRLRGEGHRSLQAPRQVARFLCGITSPQTSRERIGRHPMFGTWGGRAFREVLAFVEGAWNGDAG